ncbi:uncharacterized protein LOC143869834 [Tasmannia lanceolata]|uniref:uncharacterized protein LOC143869834 n=1 Tax=Tasmannia lanceolata TaxID=3420 RepID=UPI0040631512
MDKVLVDTLIVQIVEGYKIPNGFKEYAYVAAATTMNNFFNLNLNKEHVKNRINTMKQTYKNVCIILTRSGFGWDVTQKWSPARKRSTMIMSLKHEDPTIESSHPVSLDDIGENFADGHTPTSQCPPSLTEDPINGGSETSPLRRVGSRRQRSRQGGACFDNMSRLSSSMDKVADALIGSSAPAYLVQLRKVVRGVGGFSQEILLRTTEYLTTNPSRTVGIYYTWPECHKQVDKFSGACYRSFGMLAEAQSQLDTYLEKAKYRSSEMLRKRKGYRRCEMKG